MAVATGIGVVLGVVCGAGIFAGAYPISEITRTFHHSLEETNKYPIVQQLAQKLGISKEIHSLDCDTSYPVSGLGFNAFPMGDAYLNINAKELNELTEAEQEYAFAFALASIKLNDSLIYGSVVVPLTLVIASIASTILFLPFGPEALLAGPMIGYLVTLATVPIFLHIREKRYAKLAFSVCSEEGKAAAITFYEKKRENMRQSLGFFDRLFFNAQGEPRALVPMPTFQGRIDYIKKLNQKEA